MAIQVIAASGGNAIAVISEEDKREFVESLGDNLRMGGVCGPAVPVPADASEQDRLLANLGRHP